MNDQTESVSYSKLLFNEVFIFLVLCCSLILFLINNSKVSLDYLTSFNDERINHRLTKEFSENLIQHNVVSISKFNNFESSPRYAYKVVFLKKGEEHIALVDDSKFNPSASVWVDGVKPVWVDVKDGQVIFASEPMDLVGFDEIESQYEFARELITAAIDSIDLYETNLKKWEIK